MALDQSENFVRQGVTSSIGSADTTIDVSNASEFPDPSSGEYNLVLWDTDQGLPSEDSNVEIVRVTGRDTGTNTLTVTRGQESTSGVTHPSTSALILSPTAKMFGDIQTRTSGFNDAGTLLSIAELENDDYNQTVTTGSVSGTTGLDLSGSNFFQHTLTGDVTFTFDNPSGSPAGNSFTLVVIQDGTGGHAITWPGSVEWDSGSAPSLTTAANDKHILGFMSPDGGTTWYGVVSAVEVA